MRVSLRISLEDIFLPYLLNLSAELILTYPVLAEIKVLALSSASLQTTGPDSAQDSTHLQYCTPGQDSAGTCLEGGREKGQDIRLFRTYPTYATYPAPFT